LPETLVPPNDDPPVPAFAPSLPELHPSTMAPIAIAAIVAALIAVAPIPIRLRVAGRREFLIAMKQSVERAHAQ
jgi:hypothetical protein